MTDTGNILGALEPREREAFDTFARMMEEENKVHNLTGIRGIENIRIRHFEDSLAALGELDALAGGKSLRIIDIGSGAGLPGLAIAVARPEWHVTSLEATAKKVRFQQKVTEAIGLKNAEAMQGRAEELSRDAKYRGKFDAALARALGDLTKVTRLAMPLLRSGGLVVAWKGPRAEKELKEGRAAITKLGCADIRQVLYELKTPTETLAHQLVIITKR